jgi:hypothetical protein
MRGEHAWLETGIISMLDADDAEAGASVVTPRSRGGLEAVVGN